MSFRTPLVSSKSSYLEIGQPNGGTHTTESYLSDAPTGVSQRKPTDSSQDAGIHAATEQNYSNHHTPPVSPHSPYSEIYSESPPDSPAVGYPLQFRSALQALTAAFECTDDSALTPAKLVEVLRVGDSCIRRDASRFISSHLKPILANVWCQNEGVDPTTNRSLVERGFHSFRCAEVLSARSSIDPLRLQCARVLLYQYVEQLARDFVKNTHMLDQRSKGRDISSVVIDEILDLSYHEEDLADHEVRRRHRRSLLKHKMRGKRWSIMAQYFGSGLLLISSSTLATSL
jgi:hypothetical protein